jgi:hypothetical protein
MMQEGQKFLIIKSFPSSSKSNLTKRWGIFPQRFFLLLYNYRNYHHSPIINFGVLLMTVLLKDFQPVNSWKPDPNSPDCLIDQTTGRRYGNESAGVVRIKAILLTLSTPFVHPIAAIANVGVKLLQLVSLSHFWYPNDQETAYDFKGRLSDAGKDLSRIVCAPLVFVGLELAAVYGIVRPYDGRKLYASLERAEYGDAILAPCFQPDPRYHALGGIEILGAKF